MIRQYTLNISKLVLPVLLTALLSSQCANNSGQNLVDPLGGKSFWALKIRSGSEEPYQIPAVFMGSTLHAIAFVEVGSSVTAAQVDKALLEFENNMVAKENYLFTSPLDVNGDGKVTLLFLDIDDGYSPGGSYIAGYYDPRNQFSDETAYRNYGVHSNEQEMLYLDTYPADVNSTDFLATVAHEYQHLLHFTFKYENNTPESVWVDEGLSEVASDITGYGPQYARLDTLNSINGNSLIDFNANTVDDYAHVYIYFRYLADVYGEDILTSIFSKTDYSIKGVNAALAEQNDADLTSCNKSFAGDEATVKEFVCSYHYMWGSVLEADSSSNDYDSENTGFDWSNPTDQAFKNSTFLNYFRDKLNLKTINNDTLSLEPYGIAIYDSNNGTSNFKAGSDVSRFSLLQDATRMVVINHTVGDLSVVNPNNSASTVVIQQAVSGSTTVDSGETETSTTLGRLLEKPQPVHFRPQVNTDDFDYLKLAEPDNNTETAY